MSVGRWLLAGALWLAAAAPAGSGEEDRRPTPVQVTDAMSGRYSVTGVTVGLNDGAQRPIHGMVTLVLEGEGFKAHVELHTRYPGSDAMAARVVGAGDGRVAGDVLEGTAHTHIEAASVPGVDVGFAYVPREVGPRVRSKARAQFYSDGSVRIELENEPEPGEEGYRPTRTELVGYRAGG